MAYLVRWWLAVELIGLLALPLSYRIFRHLPDRGYAFAKVFGVLLAIWALWVAGWLGLLPYSAGSIVLVLGLFAILAAALFIREREAILGWLRASRRYVLWAEAVFLVAFLLVALLRSYAPQIDSTEKPFEYANFMAVHRAQNFAPTDPWFSGNPDAYYYFGYVIGDGLTRLTATPPSVGFNLTLVMTAGLTALAAFGLAANVAVLLRRRESVRDRWPLIAGGGAVLLLLVIGNLESVLELGAVHGWNPQWVYSRLDINGLQPAVSAHWWPDNFFGAAWRATRLGSDWNFLEFPAFSFLLGDVHPHVLALPYKLLAGGFALALLTAPGVRGAGPWRGGLLLWLAGALGLGALAATHPWDFPAFALLALALLLGRSTLTRFRDRGRPLIGGALLVVLGLLLYLPYFTSAGRGAISGIRPTEVAFRNAATVNAEGMYLPFQHFVIFWTPLLLPAAIFVGWCLARARGGRRLDALGNGIALVALLPLAWGFAVVVRHGFGGLQDELRIRGWGWLTVLALGLLLAATIAAFIVEARGEGDEEGRQGRLFLLAATGVGVLLVYGPELFYVVDSSGTRANTTFKLWYSSWTMLSLVGATGGAYALWQWRPSLPLAVAGRPALAAAGALVLLAALVFPVTATLARTNGFSGPRTLDGLAFLRSENPDEYGAQAWLNANVPGVATVLQAAGASYDEAGRVSSRTGLPTPIDWTFHEEQQRGLLAAFGVRSADVQTIYQTTDLNAAIGLLARYGIRYVVVGEPERRLYAGGDFAKFSQIGQTVYSSRTVSIYRLGPAPLTAAAAAP